MTFPTQPQPVIASPFKEAWYHDFAPPIHSLDRHGDFAPPLLALGLASGFFGVQQVGEGNVEPWQLVSPVPPALVAAGEVVSTVTFPTWGNVSADYPATAFRLFEGKTQIRVNATGPGGIVVADDTIFTLPSDHLPTGTAGTVRQPILGRCGDDGVGVVLAEASGDVVFQVQIV